MQLYDDIFVSAGDIGFVVIRCSNLHKNGGEVEFTLSSQDAERLMHKLRATLEASGRILSRR